MKFKYIIIALLAIVLLGVGYYYFQQQFSKPKADVWAYVPEHAVFVYEAQEVLEVWQTLEEKPVGEIMEALPWFVRLKSRRQDLAATTEDLEKLLKNRPVHASLHITENNNFDYLFYLPVKGVADYSALKEVLDFFKNKEGYRFSRRGFHGVEIQEFTNAEDKSRFSYFLQDNYFVGSFTPFLVEDVIRQLDANKEKGSFREQHHEIFQLSHIEKDQGNLYVNGSRIGSFLNLFLKDTYFTASFPYAAKLDMAINQDGLLMNGYTALENGEPEPYLQSLIREKPQELEVAPMVPLRASYLQFFGFEDGATWHQKLLSRKVLPEWNRLLSAYPEAQDLVGILGKRVAIAGMQSPGEEEAHRLLYIHFSSGEKAAEHLMKISAKMSQAKGDSLFQEEFGGSLITQIPYSEFPAAVFGSAFSGFEECFFLKYHHFLILSNSIQELKTLLLDIESENTWQKSVPLNQFLSKTNQEVNFGLYVNTERIWKKMVKEAESEWKAFMEEFGPYLRQFDMLALQFSALDDMLYTNFLLQATPRDVQDLKRLRFSTLQETTLHAEAASRPVLLRNSIQKGYQLFIQDTLNTIYLLDARGQELKSDSLNAPLVSEVFQLDPRKNGEQEHMFATKSSVYLFSPSFSLRPGYPVSIPGNASLQWLNVIDYNGTKMYRTLGATTSGDLFMFDIQGKNLEGWQPKRLEGALSAAPGHIRVRAKDCIYAFQKKGVIHLMNRRGESYEGFPKNLKDSLLGPVFIKPGSDFSNTLMTTITKGGELVTLNLHGKITQQVQLFKPDPHASFMLVQDKAETDFLIVRQSKNRLSLLDNKGRLLFEKDYLGAAKVLVQYFYFGADKELIAITDPVEEFTYLYDREGNLLNFEPLNSCCPISIYITEETGSYHVYKAFGDKVSLLKGIE